MGYFWVTPFDATEQDEAMQGKIYGTWLAPKLSLAEARDILKPLEEYLKEAKWADSVFAFSDGQERPSFISGFATGNTPENAGIPIRLGSRLLDEKALSKPLPELKQALQKANGDWITLGHVIAGPGTWNPLGGIAGGSNAVLPAWRKACMQIGPWITFHTICPYPLDPLADISHAALPRSWPPNNTTLQRTITTRLRLNETQSLRDLAPDTGAYVNEADPTEPSWRETFYGANYERLFEVKKRWDPRGVFWFKNAVGSEEMWEAEGEFGVENGVGQNPVRLCRREGWE